MGNWYKVTKRINGRSYHYWQRTYRVGKSVKTENRYIGPAQHSHGIAGAMPAFQSLAQPSAISNTFSVPTPHTSTTAPYTPEDALVDLTPLRARTENKKTRRWLERLQERWRRA